MFYLTSFVIIIVIVMIIIIIIIIISLNLMLFQKVKKKHLNYLWRRLGKGWYFQ